MKTFKLEAIRGEYQIERVAIPDVGSGWYLLMEPKARAGPIIFYRVTVVNEDRGASIDVPGHIRKETALAEAYLHIERYEAKHQRN